MKLKKMTAVLGATALVVSWRMWFKQGECIN